MWPLDDSREESNESKGSRRPHGGSSADVRELLGGLLSPQALSGSMLFVAAHPEDPVRGASWLLRRGPGAHVVHVTDEPPSFEALQLAGLTPERSFFLGAARQGASEELVTLTECLLALLKALRPSLVIVPPYEGRHPDQDAAAFIVHAAVALLVRGGRTPPALLEMAGAQTSGVTVHLSEADRLLKQRMRACYGARGWDASEAGGTHESYRLAPAYDFTRPPRLPMAREALETLKLVDASPH